MKKLLIATAVTMFFAVTGFAQDIMTDTINTTVIKNLPLVEPSTSAVSTKFERASGGYVYHGSEFGGSTFVGPRFRLTNRQALHNLNNGIEHGNNMCLFPSPCGNTSSPGISTGLTVRTSGKSVMLRKGRLIKMRKIRRVKSTTTSSTHTTI